jgi:DNA-binding MarR family transcriptional regulator
MAKSLHEKIPVAWPHLLRSHAAVTRAMDANLQATHGLTLSDYEVLLRLAQAPDRRMRRVDLAESVLLTQSGVTRLLQGLERSGYVERASCDSDARVVYACLTDAGYGKLRAASRTHVEDIDALFARHFDADELDVLGELLARVGEPGDDEVACDNVGELAAAEDLRELAGADAG